jgi:2-iminobutanoate/2-iminopropanoate deaminase
MHNQEYIGDSSKFGRFGNSSIVVAGGYLFAVANAMEGGAERRADLSIEDEIQFCITKLKSMLAQKRLDFDSLARCNVFLAEDGLRKKFWPSFAAEFKGGRLPVHSIYVGDMPGGCRVQLDAVALVSS